MNGPHLDLLIERLNRGETAAAEEVFKAYEPYLRMLVRRRLRPALRAKFDSMDVVQSVWADVMEGLRDKDWKFQDRARLQAFLARLARNRFLDRCRKHKTALALETSLDEASGVDSVAVSEPRASQVVQGDELWRRLLSLCPPAHQEILRLKRAGFTPGEIAIRAGLHEGSVRRILYDLARRLADSSPAESGSLGGAVE